MLVPTMLPPNHVREFMHALALTDADVAEHAESTRARGEDVSPGRFARLANAASRTAQFVRNLRIGPPRVVEAFPTD